MEILYQDRALAAVVKPVGMESQAEVPAALEKQLGITVDKRRILLDAPIKAYGTFLVPVKIFEDISGTCRVTVTQ